MSIIKKFYQPFNLAKYLRLFIAYWLLYAASPLFAQDNVIYLTQEQTDSINLLLKKQSYLKLFSKPVISASSRRAGAQR